VTTATSAKEEAMGSPRQDITLEQRIGIGLAAAANRGVYGTVSRLARECQTSRQFIYTLEKRLIPALKEALLPRRPGPAASPLLLEIDRGHLDRSILTLAMVGHAPQRAIAECLGSILKVEPSLGYVNGVLMRAGRAASRFNGSLRLSLAEAQVGIDELYAQGKGNLVAVHPESLLILALKATERVDGGSWGGTVEEMAQRGVQIARLASDGGTAIRAMVAKLVGVAHQLDLWHALRHVGRAVGVLERAAYAAIAREEELGRKAKRLPESPMMGGVVHDDYQSARQQTLLAIERYEALRLLGVWVRQALDPIDLGTGRIRGRDECLGELQAATELMRELGVLAAKKLADYLDQAGPGLLAHVDRLQLLVEEIVGELGEEGVRHLCREWQLERGLDRGGAEDKAYRQKDYLRAHLISLLYWGNGYSGARKRVADLLGSVLRGSSLVECVNSWLRPYAELRKSLGQAFLELFTLYRNSHVFRRGKRAGASPLQLAGIQTPEGDWTDWLGLGHGQAFHRSVRSLSKAA
jgi:hypothetical protein